MAQVKKETNSVRDNFYPVIAIIVVIVGVFLVINSPKTETVNNEAPATASSSISTDASKPKNLAYRGQDGKVALAILKEIAQIEITGEGQNAFVTSINGYKPDINKEFWALYVNGKQSEVGAGSLVTKNDDLIEWRLEGIEKE